MSGVVVLRLVIPDERRFWGRKGEFGVFSPGVITWLGRASITKKMRAKPANTVVVFHLGAVAILNGFSNFKFLCQSIQKIIYQSIVFST